jgi:CRISPR-associated protein Csy2
MVNINHIKEILDIEDIQTRNNTLRKCFSAYTELIEISGYEKEALIIFTNLTYKKQQVEDLLNEKLAKKTLKNVFHIDKCIDEVSWFHTHNLKYPDIRVSKQRILAMKPILHPYVISSANCNYTLGWSHNSAAVNLSKLFLCSFRLDSQIVCLASSIRNNIDLWKKAFALLGVTNKRLKSLSEKIELHLPKQSFPSSVDEHSTQILLPYRDSYLSISPVTNHSVLAEIQKLSLTNSGKFTTIKYVRPSSVGELPASLAGKIRIFNYPPLVGKVEHRLSHSKRWRLENEKDIFNAFALKESDFIFALNGLLSINQELTVKQRRIKKVSHLKQVRSSLIKWISPLIEWKSDLEDNTVAFELPEKLKISFVGKFLTFKANKLQGLVTELNPLFNTELSNDIKNRTFSFNGRLFIPIKSQIKWLLNQLASENKSNSTYEPLSSRHRYLYLQNIEAIDVQALSNMYCSGIPSLRAVWGMLHNYQREINQSLGTKIRFTSFSWFIHKYSAIKGIKLPEYGMQGANNKEFRRPVIRDNKYCDLSFNLIIHVSGLEHDLKELDGNKDMLKAFFPTRLAGGTLFPPGLDSPCEWCEIYKLEEMLFSKLKRLPKSGSWIILNKIPVADLNELITTIKENKNLCPTMLGYLLLDKPSQRANSISNLHCYAKPECITGINMRFLGVDKFFKKSFWMLDAQDKFMIMKSV